MAVAERDVPEELRAGQLEWERLLQPHGKLEEDGGVLAQQFDRLRLFLGERAQRLEDERAPFGRGPHVRGDTIPFHRLRRLRLRPRGFFGQDTEALGVVRGDGRVDLVLDLGFPGVVALRGITAQTRGGGHRR